METTAIKTIDHTYHRSGEDPGCRAVGQGRAHVQRVCTAAVSSPERGVGQSIADSTSRMQPEQCPCGVEHPPDRLRHIAVCCQGTQVLKGQNILEDIVDNAHLVQRRLRRPPFGCLDGRPVLTAVLVREPRRDR